LGEIGAPLLGDFESLRGEIGASGGGLSSRLGGLGARLAGGRGASLIASLISSSGLNVWTIGIGLTVRVGRLGKLIEPSIAGSTDVVLPRSRALERSLLPSEVVSLTGLLVRLGIGRLSVRGGGSGRSLVVEGAADEDELMANSPLSDVS
jgi:hypothetical protein